MTPGGSVLVAAVPVDPAVPGADTWPQAGTSAATAAQRIASGAARLGARKRAELTEHSVTAGMVTPSLRSLDGVRARRVAWHRTLKAA
jgi:hypothetical protein